MTIPNRNTPVLVSGNQAIALAAVDAGVALGTGYPGTPSTEILEWFGTYAGKAQWAPNEKVAMEVAAGAALAGAKTLVTMKHVGVNVAADVLFTVTYSGINGAMVLISADDPGMSSSQNEQDNRRYAVAAGIPMLEPADSQEAYDLTRLALEVSARWRIPVMLRVTTRVCHSKSILRSRQAPAETAPAAFCRDIPANVMIPAHARPAHRRLRQKLVEIAAWAESSDTTTIIDGASDLGIITSGVAYQHVREALPATRVLKLGVTYPLPVERIRAFAASVQRCLVVEEGDPYLVEQLRYAGIAVEEKPAMYRFGELNTERVRRIVKRDESSEPAPLRGKPPELCPACAYRPVFSLLKQNDFIVAGDIGCYTLGALPPLSAMDAQLCMGASIGMGLGLRHVLPPEQARRVVSVIGDSTFIHSGLTGLAEAVYNKPPTGHVIIILDNGTTAMTGQQEHPGTGRSLTHGRAGHVSIEAACNALGADRVLICDAVADPDGFERDLREAMASDGVTVLIARKPCVLAAGKIRQYERNLSSSCDGECRCDVSQPLPAGAST